MRTEVIKSRDNAKLKLARRVRDGKERDLIFIEGLRLSEEALRSPIRIREALISDTFAARNQEFLQASSLPVLSVSESIFGSVGDTENSQGIILLAERPDHDIESLGNVRLAVFLHEVNNPSNLGAVVRTAEAAGVDCIFISANSADAFSPKSIRASMGSCFRMPIIVNVSFAQVSEWARLRGIITTAADVHSKVSYTEVDWSASRLVIMGSEAHGLPDEILGEVEQPVRIPMSNGVESLNLAVSTGIILFESQRQRST